MALSVFVFAPFGHLSERVHGDRPFYGFDPQNAVLTELRFQRLPLPQCGDHACSCGAFTQAIAAPPPDFAAYKASDFHAWEPWNDEDQNSIKDCDHFPCAVKLNSSETEAMKNAGKAGRLSEYLHLISLRLTRYQQTGERKEYEFPGDPVDPWKIFEQRGVNAGLARPAVPVLFARILDFASGKIQKIHQILDRRAVVSPDGNHAVVWTRDAYTDHYFDSWGEYSQWDCDPGSNTIETESVVLGEMDMLKKTGFFERALHPRYRSAFEENGKIYLDKAFDRVRSKVEKGAKPAS